MGGVSVCADELPLAQLGRQQTAFHALALRNATKRMSDNRCTAGLPHFSEQQTDIPTGYGSTVMTPSGIGCIVQVAHCDSESRG